MAQKISEIWAQVLQHIAAQSYEEATSLVQELRALGQRRGRPAIGAADVATALLSVKDKAAVADFAKALPQVEGTWSDVAILLLSEDPTPSGVWEELAAKARRLCQGLKLDLEVPKELGFLWTPDFRPASLSLGAAKPEEELVDPATAATPEQRAILLVRGACSAESLVDAAKDAKEALSIFRDLGHRIGEATALLAVSRATVDSDLQGAQSAANQAMKLFREMGHQKGRAYAMQAAAEADKIRHNSDDAVFKANEAKKLADLMGDRALEFALCETVVDANITQDKAGHAVEAAKDAQELAVSLNDQGLKAEAEIMVAKAYGAYEESRGAGTKAAREALALYKDNPKGSVKAVEALAAATKGDKSEVVSVAQRLAETFSRGEGQKEEEVESLLVAVDCLLGIKEEVEQAQSLAQAAVKVAKGAPRKTQARALRSMAKLHLAKEEPAEGMRAAMQAANIFRSEPVQSRQIRDAEIDCVLMQIQAHAMLGNFDEAFNAGVEHGRRFKDLRNRRGEGCVLMKLAELHRRRLETEKAFKVLQFIPGLFNIAGDRVQEGLALEQIARIYLEKGDVIQAQKAADECAMNFRKYGSRFYRGRAALLVADVQVNLMSIDKGNPVQLIEAAEDAVQLLEIFDVQKSELLMAYQILANSKLFTGKPQEAMEAARKSQELGQQQKNAAAEASALLLEAGAHLLMKDIGESQRCARDAKELYISDLDDSGAASATDFLAYIQKAEDGIEDPSLFRGFSLRHVSPEAMQQKAEAKQEAKPKRAKGEKQDIYLFQCDPSSKNSDGRCIMTYFEAFEHRAGVDRQQQSKLKAQKEEEMAAQADYSKTFKDTVKQKGYPDKEPAVFAVRWVQATDEKKETSRSAKGRRDYLREEDRRVVSVASLGAPSESCGRYAKSERLEAPGERHGYKVY